MPNIFELTRSLYFRGQSRSLFLTFSFCFKKKKSKGTEIVISLSIVFTKLPKEISIISSLFESGMMCSCTGLSINEINQFTLNKNNTKPENEVSLSITYTGNLYNYLYKSPVLWRPVAFTITLSDGHDFIRVLRMRKLKSWELTWHRQTGLVVQLALQSPWPLVSTSDPVGIWLSAFPHI